MTTPEGNRRVRRADARSRYGWSTRVVLLLAAVLAAIAAGAVRADAAPGPSPAPSTPPGASACAAKAPGAVAWCMPWSVRLDTVPPGGRSHWATTCSKAVGDDEKQSCTAASITLDPTPREGTASVLMDGPSTGSGATGLINCGLMTAPSVGPGSPEQTAWTSKQKACSGRVAEWAAQVYDPDPKPADCSIADVNCKVQRGVQEALTSGIRSGIQGLVDVVVQGTVFLLSKLAGLVFTATSISSPDDAFYSTYNSLAGVLVALIFVFFILSTVINGLRTRGGPGPVASLGGLVRAVLGITFAGGIAYTIVAAWDQATNAVLDANGSTPYDPSRLVTSFTELTGGAGTLLAALVLSGMASVGLLLLFVIMLFRGVLATGAALFGAMAMTGQAMEETRHWGRRWFWTVNALGSSKFFIAELWIYSSRSAYGSDSLMNALRAVLMIWLMVAAPWILLRLTTLWDGYLSDVNGHALLSVAGNPLQLGADFASGLQAGAGGSDSSPGSGAAGLMDENSAGVPTTPGGPLGEAAGIGDGKGRQAADAAAKGGDGSQVGQTSSDPAAQNDGAGSGGPNEQEVDGLQAGADSASHDVATGHAAAPGDATGAHGSVPVTPGGAQGPGPTGSNTAGPLSPADSGPIGAGSDGGASPNSATESTQTPSSEPADGGGSRSPGRTGAAGSGGSDGAAAVAADVPIVPL
ncbi:hypothetical protein [Actinoplanes sp. NPDC026619]|uniref:hypothetical protein n=1 Tax=Actinoplanes sp. NPDC026619 TaxID=3155798 RepID=UPI003411780E